MFSTVADLRFGNTQNCIYRHDQKMAALAKEKIQVMAGICPEQ